MPADALKLKSYCDSREVTFSHWVTTKRCVACVFRKSVGDITGCGRERVNGTQRRQFTVPRGRE
jgi:hypothetical protein